MSSLHHIQRSHLQPLEGSHDPAPHLIPFFPVYDPSSFTYPAFPLYPAQPQACRQDLHCRLQDDESSLSGGSSDHPDLQLLMLSLQSKDGDHDRDDKSAAAAARGCSSAIHDAAAGDANGSVKWMSSKMRLMRRMMSGDEGAGVRKLSRRSPVAHPPPDELQQQQGITRVCSDCNTTRTPLWRSGPQGPKSLCNACGIRQRKARKAMAAAAAAVVNTTTTDHKLPKEKCPQDSGGGGCDRPIVPFKKRCKFANPPDAAAEAEGQKSFPQDEKDAAILLMALSCGTLVCR